MSTGRNDENHAAIDIESAKRRWRFALRRARSDRPEAERRAVDLSLAQRLQQALAPPGQMICLAHGDLVACYDSRPTEPGTESIRNVLAERGARVLLPEVTGPGAMRWIGDDGNPAALGSLSKSTLMLIPALAVDTAGRRLGQGGGYYDRALAELPVGVPVIAVVHSEEVFDADRRPVPALPHDRPVHGALTPAGLTMFTRRSG